MYEIVYLPIARQDMVEIAAYISHTLASPMAAAALAEELIAAADKLAEFPYANTAYFPIRPLKREYRKLLVQNHVMLYFIEEEKKQITIARVLYARRDYERLL